MTPDERITQLIKQMQSEGKLPASIGPRQLELLTKSLQRYSGQVSQRIQEKILEDFQAKTQGSMSNEIPDAVTNRGVVADLTSYVGSPEIAEIIRWSLQVSTDVAAGGGRFLNQMQSIDQYPAMELKRMVQRDVPRGFKQGPKGELIPVPDDDWPSRWDAAGGEFYDDRMIAAVDDHVWQALGDGEGGYDDALGNPFPPFAFNSGFMTFDISRKEAEDLGVIDAGEKVEAPEIDFAKFFSFK